MKCLAACLTVAVTMHGCGSSTDRGARATTGIGAVDAGTSAVSTIRAELARFHYPTAAGRRDAALASDVTSALARILRAGQQTSVPPTAAFARVFSRSEVNGTNFESNVVNVELVSDLAAGASDRDEESVTGLCEALPVAGTAVMRCSADGLAALTAEDRRRGRTPLALIYVLAHELSHVVHGDGRNFLPEAVTLDLTSPPDVKWRTAGRGCDVPSLRNKEVLAFERRADDDALETLKAVVLEDAINDPTQDRAVSFAAASVGVWIASEGVSAWARRWQHGAMLPSALADAPLAPDAAYTRWAADRTLCDVLEQSKGYLLVPTFNGTHPSEPARLALISGALAAGAPRFAGVSGVLSDEVQRLTARLGPISAVIDRQRRDFYESFGEALCQRQRTGSRPNCPHVSSTGPMARPTCPSFSASVAETSVRLSPGTLATGQIESEGFRVDGEIAIALPLRDSRWFVGRHDTSTVAWLSKHRQRAFVLPCQPASAVEDAGGIAVLCDRPLGLVRLNEDGSSHALIGGAMEYDDEPVTVDNLRGGWLGRVDGTFHATLHLPFAGKSTTVRFDADAVRSARPWRGDRCDVLPAGMSVTRLSSDGPWVGTTWSSQATSFVARFDPSFDDIVAFVHPTGSPAPFACGEAGPFHSLICADTRGGVFDPFADRGKAVGHLAMSSATTTAQSVSGRICSTTAAVYVEVESEPGGVEVYATTSPKVPFRSVFRHRGEHAELRCGVDHASVIIHDGQITRIRRL